MTVFSKFILKYKILFLMTFAIAFIIFAIWLPFGFSLIGVYEEWFMLGHLSLHELSFLVHPNDAMGIDRMRLLTVFPHALAYYLRPNSFDAWHVLLILSLWIKGIASAYLVRFMTKSNAWGLIAGIFILIYPADTMQLSFRSIHINWALSLFLMAVVLYVYGIQISKRWVSIVFALVASIIFFSGLLFYEVALPLFCLPILSFYVRYGFYKALSIFKNKKIELGIWLGATVSFLVRAIWINLHGRTYQAAIFSDGVKSDHLQLFYALPEKIYMGLWRGLLSGWIDAFRIAVNTWSVWGYCYVFACALILAFIFQCFIKEEKKEENIHIFRRMIGVGVISLILGFFLFLFLYLYMYFNQRIYLCAAIGGTIFWVGLFGWLHQKKLRLAQVIIFLFLMAALSQQLFQFRYYIQIADREREILKQLVNHFQEHVPRKKILILDQTEQLNQTLLFLIPKLELALTYFYDHAVPEMQVCYEPSKEWANTAGDFSGRCEDEEEKTRWILHPNRMDSENHSKQVLRKGDIDVVKIHPEIFSENRLPEWLIKSSHSQLKAKYQHILLKSEWMRYFQILWRNNSNGFHWSAGDYLGMSDPIRGGYWSEAAWQKIKSVFPRAFIWQTNAYSTLQFYFIPKTGVGAYKITGYAKVRIKGNQFPVTIFLNRHPLSVSWQAPYWRAKVSEKELKSGWNLLEFSNAQHNSSNHLGLSYFEIEPLIP